MGLWLFKTIYWGNPLQKILNSPREIREVLAIDLIACNNYKNGINALKKLCAHLYLFLVN